MACAAIPLILVLSRRCNKRCGFCPQRFEDQDMSAETLRLAIEGLGRRMGTPSLIKFFGGEPLLRRDLIEQGVFLAAKIFPETIIELPTNGSLLNLRMCHFFREHPKVEIFLGRANPLAASLPNVSLNFLIAPGETAENTLIRFKEALDCGLRRFNFLPAYFTSWNAEQLGGLRRSFAALGRLIAGLKRAGVAVEVKNFSRSGRIPLYNSGMVVDTDGRIYSSNLILAGNLRRHARRFYMGHVRRLGSLRPPARLNLRSLLESGFGPKVMESTYHADEALSQFLHSFGSNS